MNSPVRLTASLLGLVAALLFCGCSKQETPANKNIDVQANIEKVKSGNQEEKTTALAALAEAGPNAAPAVDVLIEALKDNDSTIKRLAAYALGQIGPKASAALPQLKECLREPDNLVTPTVINAMRSIDPKGAKGLEWAPTEKDPSAAP